MATGMLKFSPNNTVFIDLDLENHTANKAVDIDAEGVEWPLCGGVSGDLSVITATIANNDDLSISMDISYLNGRASKMLVHNTTEPINLIAYQGKVVVFGAENTFSDVTGAAEFSNNADGNNNPGLVITGVCAFTYAPMPA